MKTYKVDVDVMNIYHATVEANSEEEAREIALTEAYQDTWGGSACYGGAEVYDVWEEIEGDK